MAQTRSEYGKFLQQAYGSKPSGYYEAFLRIPVVAGQDILDWGCGLGGFLSTLAALPIARELRLYGLDLLPDSVDSTKERVPQADVRLLEPPGLKGPWPDSSFDRIFLLDVLEHVPDPESLLSELHRLLKPGGILTISTPDRWAFYKRPGAGRVGSLIFNLRRLLGKEWVDPTHRIEYTRGELKGLLARSPFGAGDFQPSIWHRSLWLRPIKKHFSFLVDLRKARE